MLPEIKVFDGTNGVEVRDFFADFDPRVYPLFTGGVFVAAGDVNGDGYADIIVSLGFGGSPEVKVFDGEGGALLLDFYAYDPHFVGGVWVAAGDVNGDGLADIITGAGISPHVKVFSDNNETLLDSFFAFDPRFIGGVRVAATDVNGDGRDDLVLAAGPFGGPEVLILDALSLAQLDAFFAFDLVFRGGGAIGGA